MACLKKLVNYNNTFLILFTASIRFSKLVAKDILTWFGDPNADPGTKATLASFKKNSAKSKSSFIFSSLLINPLTSTKA